jgi:hypothetical protein
LTVQLAPPEAQLIGTDTSVVPELVVVVVTCVPLTFGAPLPAGGLVLAALTCTVCAPDVEVSKLALPPYFAMIVCAPALVKDVVHVAVDVSRIPGVRATLPHPEIGPPLSENATVPAGAAAPVTVAVSVTGFVAAADAGADTVVVVVRLTTVAVTACAV